MTRSARLSPVGGRAVGLFSIWTIIGTRPASDASSSSDPSNGQRAIGVGDGDGVGDGEGDGDGVGLGVAVGLGLGVGVGPGKALKATAPAPITRATRTNPPTTKRAARDRRKCMKAAC